MTKNLLLSAVFAAYSSSAFATNFKLNINPEKEFFTVKDEKISIQPDFKANILKVTGIKEKCGYEILTISGESLKKGIIADGKIDLPKINDARFLVKIISENQQLTFQMLRK